MHTKKYRASPLTAKKKSNSVRRRKKIIGQTENLPTPPPPHQNQMVRPLAKRKCGESQVMFSCHAITKPRPIPIPNSNLL